MPIHVTARDKRDIVTFLSDVTVDFVSLVDHGANWSPFALIKNSTRGDVPMPGQVIQAIVMPLEMDIAHLRNLYGDEWFNRVQTHKRDNFAKKVRFTQRDETDFEEYDKKAAFVLRDIADTGGHFVVGTLKSEKRSEQALMLPSLRTPPINQATPEKRSKRDPGGNNPMTTDEIKKLIATSLAETEARIIEEVRRRVEDLQTRVKAIEEKAELAEAPSQDSASGTATKTAKQQGAMADIIEQLEALNGRIKSVAEKQESLEHTALGRPSTSEDTVLGGRTTRVSPFRGMFAGL